MTINQSCNHHLIIQDIHLCICHICSVEANANGAAATLKASGMLPVVRKQESKGKVFWRVLVGPASSAAERDALLKQIKAAGFTDSYAVTN